MGAVRVCVAKNQWGTCRNISLAFCFEELQSEILPSGQKKKKVVSVLHEEISALSSRQS